ncbi:hypothetical protein EC968_003829, partial [Mortierella alpina]
MDFTVINEPSPAQGILRKLASVDMAVDPHPFKRLGQTGFNENAKLATRRLLDFGLEPVVHDIPSLSPNTAQIAIAKSIIQLLGCEPPSFEIGKYMRIEIVPSDAHYVLAAKHFQVDLVVFSTKTHPRIFKSAFSGTAPAVGLFEIKDSYEKTSEIMILGPSRTPPKASDIEAEQTHLSSYQSEFPLAVFREERRRKSCTVTDHADDEAAFKLACLQEIDEQVQSAIKSLTGKRNYKHPRPTLTRSDLQATEYARLKAKLQNAARIPRGLMDKALKLVSGVWKDMVLSLFHWCWARNWADPDEAAISNPDPDYRPAEDYARYKTRMQGLAQRGLEEATDETPQDFRTIAMPFKKLLRPVAAGWTEPLEVDSPPPSLDIRRLIPQGFELPEDLDPI